MKQSVVRVSSVAGFLDALISLVMWRLLVFDPARHMSDDGGDKGAGYHHHLVEKARVIKGSRRMVSDVETFQKANQAEQRHVQE